MARPLRPALAAAAVLTSLALAALLGDEGHLSRAGRTHRFPVPRWSLRVAATDGAATYLAAGRPSVREMLAARAPADGWRYVEQMGSAHFLRSDQDRLDVVERREASVFVRIDYEVAPLPAAP
jgi:hypothetical protein